MRSDEQEMVRRCIEVASHLREIGDEQAASDVEALVRAFVHEVGVDNG